LKLRELNGRFLRSDDNGATLHYEGVTLADAHGIIFLCPKCFEANGGEVGTHSVICWFNDRGVPADRTPGPGRWNPSGTGLDDLTFVGPGAVSVQLTGEGCSWHGFIKNGEATLS
jgi:hypothetical protein